MKISVTQSTTTVEEKLCETQRIDVLKVNLLTIFMTSKLVVQYCVLTMQNERCLMLLRSLLNVIKRDANTATTIQLPSRRKIQDFPQFSFKRLNENLMETKFGP
jgi:hypothetical protein